MMHLSPYYAPADQQGGGNAASFCPNCGHPVSSTDTFCQNCGYNLMTNQEPTNGRHAQPQAPVQPQAPQPKPQPQNQGPVRAPRQPWSKKKKWQWGGIAAAVVIIAGLGFWGGHYYSRAATLDRAVKSVKSGKNMTKYFTSGSASLKMTNATLLPLSRYYRSSPKALNTLKGQLQASGNSSDGDFTYQKNGHHFLFFPKYQVSVTPVYPTVTTNHQDTKILLDNKTIATADSDDYSKRLGALVPGQYHLQATGKVGKHNLTNSSDYHITKNTTYDLDLTTITATINTNPGSDIYLNGKKLGATDANGTYNLKDEPWSDNMNIYAEYSSAGGTARTKSVKIKKSDDGNNDLELNYPGLISRDTADDFFTNLFNMIDQIANGSDEDDVSDDDSHSMTGYFDNGSSNKQYQEFVKMADGYDDDDNISSTDMGTTIDSIVPGPNGRSLVTYTVKYKFWPNTDDDDDDDDDDTVSIHVQEFQYTATLRDTSNDNSADMNYQITTITGAKSLRNYHEDE